MEKGAGQSNGDVLPGVPAPEGTICDRCGEEQEIIRTVGPFQICRSCLATHHWVRSNMARTCFGCLVVLLCAVGFFFYLPFWPAVTATGILFSFDFVMLFRVSTRIEVSDRELADFYDEKTLAELIEDTRRERD